MKDLRPIALMDSSYKIFMGIIRAKLDEHLERNNLVNELQAGSTKGRRCTDNIFIINYCIGKCYKMKKPLYLLSSDFQKAFDSIKRVMLIHLLKELKVDSNIINVIAKVYTGDLAKLFINNKEVTQIDITSGIKQGCNGSTTLFLIITYYIIKKLQEANIGYKDELFYIPGLFYVDDGLVLAESKEELRFAVEVLQRAAQDCGLKLNKKK